MSDIVQSGDLHPGDVLLYHGTSWLSKMIRLFDGGDYSHSSIWSGTEVVEALDGGITLNTVKDSASGCAYVDVFRFRDAQGRELGAALPPDPVINRIEYYKANRQRYAYEQLLLLALLTRVRTPPGTHTPLLLRIIRNIVDGAASVIERFFSMGKEPVICSELVHRCYKEAGEAYNVLIRGADVASIFAVQAAVEPCEPDEVMLRLATNQMMARLAMARQAAANVASAQARTSAPAGISSVAAVAVAARKSKRQASSGRTRAHAADDILIAPEAPLPATTTAGAAVMAVSDFVTPRDLQYSPSLYRVGTLAR